MIDLLTLVVLILAAARITRGVVWDKLTLPFRAWVIKKSGLEGKISYLVHCVVCTGFWAAFIAIPHTIWPHSKWLFTCYLILAIAEVVPRWLNWENRHVTGGE